MSALGHKRTSSLLRAMSALPPKADITETDCHDMSNRGSSVVASGADGGRRDSDFLNATLSKFKFT
jgi:hypothetical protein